MMAEQAAALLLVLAAGVGVSLQSALLGAVRVRQGVLLSMRLSFAGTFAGCAALNALGPGSDRLLLGIAALAVGAVLAAASRGLPRGYWGAGLLGLLYIAASGYGVTRLGVGVTVAVVVAGQLLASLGLDAAGMLGVPRRPITTGRLAGAILLVAGVALIRLG